MKSHSKLEKSSKILLRSWKKFDNLQNISFEHQFHTLNEIFFGTREEYAFLVRFKQPVMNDVFNIRFKRFNNFKRKRKKSLGIPYSSISYIRKHILLFLSKFENACFYGLTEINIFSIENLPKGHLVFYSIQTIKKRNKKYIFL